jgi:hypothetical protein
MSNPNLNPNFRKIMTMQLWHEGENLYKCLDYGWIVRQGADNNMYVVGKQISNDEPITPITDPTEISLIASFGFLSGWKK